MAIINCPECGNEISDQVQVCIHCGYCRNHTARRRKRKLILIGVSATVLVMIAVSFVVLWYLSPTKQLDRAIQNNDVTTIIALYYSHHHDNDYIDYASHSVAEYIARLIDDCANGQADILNVINMLQILDEAYPSQIVIDSIVQLKQSKQAYQKALECERNSDTIGAIQQYQNVISLDIEYYASAQSELQKLYKQIYDQALESIKDSVKDAYNLIQYLPMDYNDPDGMIDICHTYIDYCDEFYWDKPSVTIFDSDFYYKKGKLYWNCDFLTFYNSVFMYTTSVSSNNLVSALLVSGFSGKWPIIVNDGACINSNWNITFKNDTIIVVANDRYFSLKKQ